MNFVQRLTTFLLAMVAIGVVAPAALRAQEPVEFPASGGNRPAGIDDAPPLPTTKGQAPKLNIAEALGLGGKAGGEAEHVTFSAAFELVENTRKGTLNLTATMAPGWHVYSVTQQKGGPMASTIKVAESADYKLLGPFVADRKPHSKMEEFWDVPAEEHEGQVTWSAPLELPEGVQPDKLTINVVYSGQVCRKGQCIPLSNQIVEARFAGLPSAATAQIADGSEAEKVTFSAAFEMLENSRQGTLSLTAKVEPKWHVYSVTQQKGGPMASKIKVTESPDFKMTGTWVADQPPHIKQLEIYKVPVEEHEGTVVWSAPIELTDGVKPESLTIEVIYSGQVCSDVCIPIFNRKVEAKFAGFTTKPAPQAPARAAPTTKPIDASGLLVAAAIGFLGGMILNFMPCVLPVIGLKVLSFAQQGGQRRGRIFTLNLWFFFGIMAVFLALATLAAVVNLFWGEQFTYTWFKVALILVTFAMALSFLGVWEIPIPGFSQSTSSDKNAAEEGLGGAFFKGMFTTLLATPCSGPLLGPLFTFVAGSSPIVAYVLFGSIGLGMGLPYLVIGAFPRLVYWLPKPGAWMETFKQLMGFVLLFTLVYLFWSVPSYYVPTLASVIGVWLACWWIGRVPVYEETSKQVWAWAQGAAVAVLVGVIAFSIFGPKSAKEELIAWQPFSQQQLSKELSAGKTVMIDFTANWCPTCQLNTYYAIETPKVKELLEKNNVVPMLADWTEHSPEIKAKLQELQSASIPFLAIYPGGKPGEPIRLQDVISEKQLLEALAKAGPSKSSVESSAATGPVSNEVVATGGRASR